MILGFTKFHKRRCGQNAIYLIVLKSQIWVFCLFVFLFCFWTFLSILKAEILTHLKSSGYVFLVTKVQVETKHQNDFHLLGVENSNNGEVIISIEVFVIERVGIGNSVFT